MRTTLILENDLAERLAKLARASRKPFEVVVNEAPRVRAGNIDAVRA